MEKVEEARLAILKEFGLSETTSLHLRASNRLQSIEAHILGLRYLIRALTFLSAFCFGF
jgi:hypothetical protein